MHINMEPRGRGKGTICSERAWSSMALSVNCWERPMSTRTPSFSEGGAWTKAQQLQAPDTAFASAWRTIIQLPNYVLKTMTLFSLPLRNDSCDCPWCCHHIMGWGWGINEEGSQTRTNKESKGQGWRNLEAEDWGNSELELWRLHNDCDLHQGHLLWLDSLTSQAHGRVHFSHQLVSV